MSVNTLFFTSYTSEENVRKLSQVKNEPEWLLNRRLHALNLFETLPIDQDTLFYKYTSFRSFDPEKLEINLEMDTQGAILSQEKEDADLIQTNNSYQIQSSDTSNTQYIFDLNELIAKDEALAKKIITSADQISQNFDKLGCLARAFSRNITIIYISKDTILDKPLIKLIKKDDQPIALFDEVIIFCESGVNASILEIFEDEEMQQSDQLFNSLQTVILEDNANVNLMQIQNWSKNTVHILSRISKLSRYSKLKTITHLQGSSMSRVNSSMLLSGQGSEGYDLFMQFGNEKQRFDVKSELEHISSDTIGQTHARTVMLDKAESILRGLIIIPVEGVNADSWLTSRGMTMGKAKISAVPSLKILQNDVKAAHAASVEPINTDLLFYLESRGIFIDIAKEMIIKGYFERILKEMDNHDLVDKSRSFLSDKWQQIA